MKFHIGDFSLDNAPWSGRPDEVDSDQIETLIENNHHCTMQETTDILKISSVENHLLDYVNHFDVLSSTHIKKKNLLDHIFTCNSLLKHNKNVPFLKQIVTGNKKQLFYNNVEQKRSQSKQNEPPPTTPKASLHSKKVGLERCPLL